jgi:hypothetical protein
VDDHYGGLAGDHVREDGDDKLMPFARLERFFPSPKREREFFRKTDGLMSTLWEVNYDKN